MNKKIFIKEEGELLSPSGTCWRAYLLDSEINQNVPLYLGSFSSEALKQKVSCFVNGKIDFEVAPLIA